MGGRVDARILVNGRRTSGSASDGRDVSDGGRALLALYDRALPEVYGYLFDRCRDAAIQLLDPPADHDDPWDAHLDEAMAADVLCQLGDHHRAALTLRYVDGLPVAEVAELLDRTLHATEALLVRARAAYRRIYEKGASDAV